MNQKRIIIITGGSRGIGAATAALFIERGDQAYILDVKSPLPDLAKLTGVKYIDCDVS